MPPQFMLSLAVKVCAGGVVDEIDNAGAGILSLDHMEGVTVSRGISIHLAKMHVIIQPVPVGATAYMQGLRRFASCDEQAIILDAVHLFALVPPPEPVRGRNRGSGRQRGEPV